jgi:hypothetical protein
VVESLKLPPEKLQEVAELNVFARVPEKQTI